MNYKIIGAALSPLHIGSGETLDTLEYVMKNRIMMVIDQNRFIGSISENDRKRFLELIDQNKMIELRSFIRNKAEPGADYVIYSASVSSEVYKEYEEKIGDRRLNNQLLINSFIRSPYSSSAYIPGSSLKGAIRTAILDKLTETRRPSKYKSQRSDRFAAGILEAELLDNVKERFNRNRQTTDYGSNIQRDPFRMVKISDLNLPEGAITVGHILNVRRERTASIPMTYEVIKPGTQFSGTIRLLTEERKKINSLTRRESDRINHEITLTDIIDSCNSFYRSSLDEEIKRFGTLPAASKYYKIVKNYFDKLNTHEIMVRMGKFSQIEYMTLPDYRNPRVSREHHYNQYGKTRNLYEGKMPPGWVKIAFFDA